MNNCNFIGNLTRDPELHTTPNGKNVVKMSIAVNRKMPDANGQKVTDFIDVTAWNRLADLCAQYLAKGRKIAVTGELQTHTYEKDGVKHKAFEIVADRIEFLNSANNGQNGAQGDSQEAPATTTVTTASGEQVTLQEDNSDELPF